tara:strand:+ start:579 stop:1172 length:594 start_codon:yes stop_codon:yes gene_type:complete
MHKLKIKYRPLDYLLAIILMVLFIISVSISRPLAKTKAGSCVDANRTPKKFQATTTTEKFTKHTFNGIQGAKKNIEDYLGKKIILNIWATWCAPCLKELPQLDSLKKILRDDKIEVLAISIDKSGGSIVKKFFHLNDIKNLEILSDPSGKILKKIKIRGIPTTILINSKGYEIGRVEGIMEWNSPKVVTFLRRCLEN